MCQIWTELAVCPLGKMVLVICSYSTSHAHYLRRYSLYYLQFLISLYIKANTPPRSGISIRFTPITIFQIWSRIFPCQTSTKAVQMSPVRDKEKACSFFQPIRRSVETEHKQQQGWSDISRRNKHSVILLRLSKFVTYLLPDLLHLMFHNSL